MRIKMKRFLGILLSLALVLGLFPSMSLTAYANTETLLTTITATGTEQASYSTANVATVSFSNLPDYGSSYRADWGWWGYGWSATVNAAEGYTITKCVFYDDANYTATDSSSPFVVETTEYAKYPLVNGSIISNTRDSKGIKKIEVYGYATPTHPHSFTYSASGATITATCSGEGDCDLTNKQATLTIAAAGGTYDGTTAYSATVTNNIPAVTGDTVGDVAYYKVDTQGATTGGTVQTGAPTGAGYYYASVTLTSGSNTYTAVKAFTVAKIDPTAPTGLTATIGQTLADVSLPESWSWIPDATTSVGNLGNHTFQANFAGNDYYNAASNVDVTVTVSKATPAKPAAPTAASITTNSVTLTATDGYQYKCDNGGWQDSAEFTGLTEGTEYTFYQQVKGDDTHNDSNPSDGANIRTKQEPVSYAVASKSGNIILITITTIEEYIKAQNADSTVWLKDCFYVVQGNVNLNRGLVYSGNVRIILCNNSKLTVKGGIWHYGSELTIYSQDGKSGEIIVDGDKNVVMNNIPEGATISKDSALDGGTININGGKFSVLPGADQSVCGTGATIKFLSNVSFTGTKGGGTETLTEGSYGADKLNQFTNFKAEPAAFVTKAPTAKTGLTANGSAQELVTAGVATGGTMQYALGTATEATEQYTPSIPAKTNAGTYYVWYIAKGNEGYTDSEPVCVTVTISSRSSSGSSSSSSGAGGGAPASSSTDTKPSSTGSESYTIPVENENSVNVDAAISDGTAKISDISDNQIAQATETGTTGDTAGETTDNNTLTIDVSGAKQEVNTVELPKTTVDRLADTTADTTNNVDTVTIQMTNAKVEMDAQTLQAVSDQAEGKDVKLVVDDTSSSKLTSAQQSAINKYSSATTFEAYFESNGQRIGDFKGGTAKVSVKYTAPAGLLTKFLHMLYVAVTGETEYFPTSYYTDSNGIHWVQGDLKHFSDYAIVYDETKLNKDGEVEADPYSGLDQSAFDADESDFVDDDVTVLANGQTAYANGIDINKSLKVSQTGSNISVSWGKVKGATGYKVYAGYCEKNMSADPVKTLKKTKLTIKKLDGKKLNLEENYKVCVVAYKTVDGVDKVLGRTITAHVVGSKNTKYSNPKKLTIKSKTKVTLKKGKTTKIKATVTLVNKRRKSLTKAHAAKFRYASSDKKIATVTKNGKVKALKKGTCFIFVYAKNGYAKKVKITVK